MVATLMPTSSPLSHINAIFSSITDRETFMLTSPLSRPCGGIALAFLLSISPPAQAQTPSQAQAEAASPATRAANADVRATLPFDDRRDYDFAARGFLGTRKDPLIHAADGHIVWDLNAFDFTKGKAADTVNPSLWRQAQLLTKAGLFRAADHVYQVRGFDISNITFVRGEKGWIIIDPLTTIETARAAYDLVTEKLGKRPISAIIYTHSHADHFGGSEAFTDDLLPGAPIIAPIGFLDAVVSENIIAGPAMTRRATYQFGMTLKKGETGTFGSGIGLGIPHGTSGLIPPTREVKATGETHNIDGVRVRFQLALNTEAPAEMNLDFPDWKVVNIAENANPSQHNILTPRGAVVRDTKAWANALTEAIDFFAGAEVLIGGHGWPRFGKEEITTYLSRQRDVYAFLHDQTVRLMNKGLTGDEIAARLKLPATLERSWYNRPYYGTLSFNARAVYQYYMGWYDANPAHLIPLPPEDGGKRYVEALGGAERVRALAQLAYDNGDYGWAAELLNRAVFADAGDGAARALLARVYQQLAWQAESSLWRNIYLTGAQELVDGPPRPQRPASGGRLSSTLSPANLFNVLAVRLDAEKAEDGNLHIAFDFPDRKEQITVTVANGVLIHRPGIIGTPGATLHVRYDDLLGAFLKGEPLASKIASGAARIEGDARLFTRLLGWVDQPDPAFAIVTP